MSKSFCNIVSTYPCHSHPLHTPSPIPPPTYPPSSAPLCTRRIWQDGSVPDALEKFYRKNWEPWRLDPKGEKRDFRKTPRVKNPPPMSKKILEKFLKCGGSDLCIRVVGLSEI